MYVTPAQVAAGSVASAFTIVASSAVRDGVDETTGWALGVIAAGIAVFKFMDRRAQLREAEITAQRRRDDETTAARIRLLEEQLTAERQAHVESIREMTDRLVAALTIAQSAVDGSEPA